MKVIRATQQMLETRTLVLGFQGENLRTQLRIDCTATFAEYQNATPALAIKPPAGETYPVFVERDGNEVVWDIVANNLVLKGDGELQLTFYKDNVIAKTVIGTIRVNRSLQIDGEMPDVVATWIENANRKLAEVDAQIIELEGMVDTATDAATRAEQSASTASAKAEQAAGSAATATEKATEATNAAGTATAKAAEAALSATQARNSAMSAADSERIATAKAGDATTAAGTATAKAEQATEAAQTATEKAGEASASATAAQASATDAAASATAASASETAAKASETAAGASATQAAQSAQTANTAAQTATQKAGEASQSATNAAASATNAATSAETASTKAGEAAQSAQAVEQTAEQLAESLEQIEQNTQDIAELDERKANIDGYYPDMTVGNAEQLNSSKYVENSEPYTFRTSGGTADIGNREYLDAVVGGTVAWNQMVRDEASENQTDFAPIVTVTDAVEDAAGVKVKIEPVQDLHGYDYPWPAGGGKNILPFIGRNETKSGITVSYDESDQTYILNGTSTSQMNIDLSVIPREQLPLYNAPLARYVMSVEQVSGSMTIAEGSGITFAIAVFNDAMNDFFRGQTNNTSLTGYYGTANRAIDTTSAYHLMIQLWRTGTVLNNVKLRIQIVNTADSAELWTAWTPYSNICPITGWDGVKVTRTGKNLFDTSIFTENGGVLQENGMYRFSYINALLNKVFYKNVGYTGQLVVTLERKTDVGKQSLRAVIFYTDGTSDKVGAFYATGEVDTYTVVTASGKIVDRITGDYGSNLVTYARLQIELGSTATDYEPYAGNTYSITLPTEAGTVYGGELTVNEDGSGSLVVDRAGVVYDGSSDEKWAGSDSLPWRYGIDVNGIKQGNALSLYVTSNLLKTTTDHWSVKNYGICNNYGQLVVGYPPADNNLVEFRAFLSSNPLQVVYLLATPITYTLTASQIRTLLGQNHLWSDAGQTALTYTGTDEHLTLESGKKYLSRISGTDSMLLGSGQEITAAKGTDNVFDLTQMFGTAVADYVYGQGAAFFRKWFGKQWYPYNAGELLSVEGLQSHDMVGFNLFDKSTATDGKYVNGPGTEISDSARGHSAIIPVFPSTYYYCTGYAGQSYYAILWLDGNERPITDYSGASKTAPFTARSPANARYAILNYHLALKDSVCFHFAHNGSRNGEYEPYEKHSYPLDSTVILRGIPKVGANGVYWDGDRYLPDGTVERRYGVVDLGTLNWGTNNAEAKIYQCNPPNMKRVVEPPYENRQTGVICSIYSVSSQYQISPRMDDKSWLRTENQVFIRDTSYANAAALKASLSGVYLVYELAEPTIETAQPYHSTQWVSDWGTEEFVSTGFVPVGSETRYPANLRDKLQHLPDAASGNGSYLITQTDGQMVLTPFPAPPSTAGNYVLKATVTGGVATYTWEVAT